MQHLYPIRITNKKILFISLFTLSPSWVITLWVNTTGKLTFASPFASAAAAAGCWLLAAGCWLLAAGCWLLGGLYIALPSCLAA
jgi:hypothetical protein